MFDPALVIETEPILEPSRFATAVGSVAPLPPPEKTTLGADEYPEPPAVRLTAETEVPVKTASPVAPAPPPPEKVNKGTEVNPFPPFMTVTEATPTGANTGCAVAPDPVPVIVADGAVV